MITLVITLTDDEHGKLLERVHDHNAELRADYARDGQPPPHRDQTPESYVVDVVRDELGLDPLEEPRIS